MQQQELSSAPANDHVRRLTKRTISVSRGSAAYPRKRAVTACQVCRARRTKCDQKKPSCSFCESIGAECTSDPGTIPSTFDPASIAILERLHNLESKFDSIACISLRDDAEAGHLRRGKGSREETQVDLRLENFLPETLDTILKWPVFRSLDLPVVSTPGQFSPVSVQSSTQAPAMSDELNPAVCNQWLDGFFRHSHCKNPVLDEQQTRWDIESCLALLVCANGALACPLSSPSASADEMTSSVSHVLFTTALKRIGSTLGSAGIVQAQCLFLAGVFLMSWRMFLQALAVSQSFMSCDSRRSNAAEESIYWSSWKSERELRWELGLPDFGEMGGETPRSFPSCSEADGDDNLRAWYFYLSDISLWRLETAAKKDMRTLVDEKPARIYDKLIDFAEESLQRVTNWRDSLAASVSIAEDDFPKGDDGDILKFVLKGRTTYFHELITQEASGVRRLEINRPGYYHRHHGTWLMIRSSARSACILLAAAQNSFTAQLLPSNWQEAVEATILMIRFWSSGCEGLASVAHLLECLFKIEAIKI
ncbi:uncharacterized protein LY89DRAFT_704840 [Mollisia scopiformis]|uniref:Zn(2)-C6 fungal-type domain-containing protein n=1 Tax=Mollisia scopiformis TaxID=149040 RepID=A0A194XR41_MOLSC|nr:uncharacterized protein LY89DRAFT_704840 [Mollisia scopiformis]KUJ22197.1 hypothetical protein LY89DRAFT_704840 [Mollisia scopiformis]